MRICGNCDCLKTDAFAGQKFSQCTICKSVYYCSIDCQREAWKHHKSNCNLTYITLKTELDILYAIIKDNDALLEFIFKQRDAKNIITIKIKRSKMKRIIEDPQLLIRRKQDYIVDPTYYQINPFFENYLKNMLFDPTHFIIILMMLCEDYDVDHALAHSFFLCPRYPAALIDFYFNIHVKIEGNVQTIISDIETKGDFLLPPIITERLLAIENDPIDMTKLTIMVMRRNETVRIRFSMDPISSLTDIPDTISSLSDTVPVDITSVQT